jgi:hypothetical protein
LGKNTERGEEMKWGKLTGMGGGKPRGRSRRARHVLAAKMSARGSRQMMGQRVGVMLLLVGSILSLLVIGMITSAGMDKLLEKLLYQNSDFTLRRFHIEPANKIGKGELVAASGVRIGQNLLQLSLDEVRDSLEKLPTVASVRVERRLPDTLYLYIEERKLEWIMRSREKNLPLFPEDVNDYVNMLANTHIAMLRVPYEIQDKYKNYIYKREKDENEQNTVS